jgi:peptidoglycan hydrolase CwlO-like protein
MITAPSTLNTQHSTLPLMKQSLRDLLDRTNEPELGRQVEELDRLLNKREQELADARNRIRQLETVVDSRAA